jgi:hypothetical protein
VTLDHTYPMCFLSLVYTCSHECRISLSIFMMLSLTCIIVESFGLPSVEM